MLHTMLVISVIVAFAGVTAVALAAVGLALKYGGRREDPAGDREALIGSRFTIPVSVVLPLDAAAPDPNEMVASLLGLNYPEFEVIVVADGRDGRALEALKIAWALSACEFFYRRSLATADVRRIYRSARDPRLMLVEKTAAGRADALNCGLNLARFRYVSVLDTRIAFDADALLRAMSAPLKDPAVVAATSHVEIRADDGRLSHAAARQWLDSSRSLMESRVVWRGAQHGLGPDDAVVTWRRDAVLQAGGFSTRVADPDLDLMVRLQAPAAADTRTRATLARTTEIFGQASPLPRAAHWESMVRRRRAVLEALTAWWRHGGPDGRTLAYFVLFRLVTPLCGAWAIVGLVVGFAAGWFSWQEIALMTVMVSLARALITTSALLLRGSSPRTPDGWPLARLLLLAPCELVLYGPAGAAAGVAGLWEAIGRRT